MYYERNKERQRYLVHEEGVRECFQQMMMFEEVLNEKLGNKEEHVPQVQRQDVMAWGEMGAIPCGWSIAAPGKEVVYKPERQQRTDGPQRNG